MSKLVQIEAALKRIDAANFQRLCDTYLAHEDYEQVNPIGLALGTSKVTIGTPDTWFKRPDGKYVLAEYWTAPL